MTIRSMIMKIVQQEAVNFHLTNSIPRRLVTRWTGWFSKIENPAWFVPPRCSSGACSPTWI